MFRWPTLARQERRRLARTRVRAGTSLVTELVITVANPSDAADRLQLAMNESYQLTVEAPVASLIAPEVWGALRGLETLSQLVEWQPPQKKEGSSTAATPAWYALRYAPWHIRDEPALPHRGVLIDTARHFLPVDTILRQIDALAFNKMNVLHWHAVDADSFPLEMTGYSVPAFSCQYLIEPQQHPPVTPICHDKLALLEAGFVQC